MKYREKLEVTVKKLLTIRDAAKKIAQELKEESERKVREAETQ